jgi:hypothetical protein
MRTAAAIVVALCVCAARNGAQATDPFDFFAPTIRLTPSERQRLDTGQPAVRMLDGRNREVAVFAAARTNITADRLVAWVHRIDALKKSALVPVIQRFSDPPAMGDLSRMVVPVADLRSIRDCQPLDCDVKLTSAEMSALKPAALGGTSAAAESRLHDRFREMLLDRVRRYLAGGSTAVGQYDDGSTTGTLQADFAALLGRSPYLTERLAPLAAHLLGAPAHRVHGIESFLYWSQDTVRSRPVLAATHVAIIRGRDATQPLVLVAGKQIFALHYMNASLSVTALIGGATPGAPTYLVYINRTDVDVISGFFGGLARSLIEGRIHGEANTAIVDLRKRLESGPPPKG